ncbi:acyltransferase [bacterium]|nr:acyltransferase [bacterium]
MRNTDSSTRNFSIDVLRGLSIVLVVVHHLALPFRLPLAQSVIADWLPRRVISALGYSGYASVYVFFVLSGFLIARRALLEYGSLDRINARQFYLRRCSRILPLFFALLAMLCLMHWLQVPEFVINNPNQSLGGALGSALTLQLNWYEGQTSWLPGAWDVLWSLSIEEMFYLLFPVLCLLLPRQLLILSLLCFVLSLPYTRAALDGRSIWQEKAYLPAMSAISLGVLCAILANAWQPSKLFAKLLLGLGVTALCGALLFAVELWRALSHSSLLWIAASAAQSRLPAQY